MWVDICRVTGIGSLLRLEVRKVLLREREGFNHISIVILHFKYEVKRLALALKTWFEP